MGVLPHSLRRGLLVQEVLLFPIARVMGALRPGLHLARGELLRRHTRRPAVLEHEQVRVRAHHVYNLLG